MSDYVDPLRRLFPLVDVDLAHPARIDAGGDWRVSFPGSSHVRFGAAVCGSGFLTTGGGSGALRLEAGDGYLLTRGQSYSIGSDPALPAQDGMVLMNGRQGGRIRIGTRTSASFVSGRFKLDELSNELLLRVLPPVVVLRGNDATVGSLRSAIEMVDHETQTMGFGSSLISHHVAQIMLVQALRLTARAPQRKPLGWLAMLADPRIGLAMEAMHQHVGKRWTVAELASLARMSRSLFAKRFKDLTGDTPLDYLLHLRMRIAHKALQSGDRNIAAVGYELGYRSESAFTVAFKRVLGKAPIEVRRASAGVCAGRARLPRPASAASVGARNPHGAR